MLGRLFFLTSTLDPKIFSSTDRVKKQRGARALQTRDINKILHVCFLAEVPIVQKCLGGRWNRILADKRLGGAVRVANAFDLETVRTGAIRCREGRGGRLTGPSPSECQGPAAWFALPPSATAADPDTASGRGYRATRWAVCFKEVRYTVSNAINRNKIISLTVNFYPKTKWCRQ